MEPEEGARQVPADLRDNSPGADRAPLLDLLFQLVEPPGFLSISHMLLLVRVGILSGNPENEVNRG